MHAHPILITKRLLLFVMTCPNYILTTNPCIDATPCNSSDADVWDIFADFHNALLTFGISDSGNSDLSFVRTNVPDQVRALVFRECRLKQFRCLVTVDQWEKGNTNLTLISSFSNLMILFLF